MALHEQAAELQQRAGNQLRAQVAWQRATHAQERYRLALDEKYRLEARPAMYWMHQGLCVAQARCREPEVAPGDVAAEAAAFLDQLQAAEGIGAQVNCLLLDFLAVQVLPQAQQAAELGIDPTLSLEVIIAVLRMYADALERPGLARSDRSAHRRSLRACHGADDQATRSQKR